MTQAHTSRFELKACFNNSVKRITYSWRENNNRDSKMSKDWEEGKGVWNAMELEQRELTYIRQPDKGLGKTPGFKKAERTMGG